ncbi:MAG: hypothetical protein ACE3JK_04675 [Sporolactobacillus sp.]
MINFLDEIDRVLTDIEVHCLKAWNSLNELHLEPLMHYPEKALAKIDLFIHQIRLRIERIRNTFERACHTVTQFLDHEIPHLIANEAKGFADAVAGELYHHFVIVGKNKTRLYRQIQIYKEQVQAVGSNFQNADVAIAHAMHGGHLQETTAKIVSSNYTALTNFDFLAQGMSLRTIVTKMSVDEAANFVSANLVPLLLTLRELLNAVEVIVDGAIIDLNGGAMIIESPIPVKLIAMFTDWVTRFNQEIRHMTENLEDFRVMIRALKNGVDHLLLFLPDLVTNYEPYISQTMFPNEDYSDVRLYDRAAVDLLQEMRILFKDIIYQLSSQHAQSITALKNGVQSIFAHIEDFARDVQRGV